MANPGPKRPADMIWPDRRSIIRSDKCISCGSEAITFRDALSVREYGISGMCQTCQDQVFSVELISHPVQWDGLDDDVPF